MGCHCLLHFGARNLQKYVFAIELTPNVTAMISWTNRKRAKANVIGHLLVHLSEEESYDFKSHCPKEDDAIG